MKFGHSINDNGELVVSMTLDDDEMKLSAGEQALLIKKAELAVNGVMERAIQNTADKLKSYIKIKEHLIKLDTVPKMSLVDQVSYYTELGIKPSVSMIDGEKKVVLTTENLIRLNEIRLEHADNEEDKEKFLNFISLLKMSLE